MTKLEIKAIQNLPRKYIRDGIQFCVYERPGNPLMVVVVHHLLPPIVFSSKTKKWTRIRFETLPTVKNISFP